MAAAVEKLADSKSVVRGLALRMLRRLMAAVRPQPVLEQLAARGGGHASWRVREEVANAHTVVSGRRRRPGFGAVCRLRLLPVAPAVCMRLPWGTRFGPDPDPA